MATIKSYTDLPQSKVLSKILRFESADMYYISGDKDDICFGSGVYEEIADWLSDGTPRPADIPCWSLAALLNGLPEIQGGKPIIALDDNYITYPHMSNLHTKADNLVDACYGMILKLHGLNLL